MKRHLAWRLVSREELASHLHQTEVLDSEAIGEATLYRCASTSGETVAVSLPGDRGAIVEIQLKVTPALERRRRKPV